MKWVRRTILDLSSSHIFNSVTELSQKCQCSERRSLINCKSWYWKILVILFIAMVFIFNGPPITVEYVEVSNTPSSDSHKLSNSEALLRNRLLKGSYHRGRSASDGTWFSTQGDFEVYAYSAFYDDRISLNSLPVIRIVAVTEDLADKTIHCIVEYEKGKGRRVNIISHFEIGAGASRHGKEFKEYVLECSLGSEYVPKSVGLVMDRNKEPDFMMPVEIPQRIEPQLNFVACVSVSYWKIDPYKIVEWMEFQKLLGVGGVVVYNNTLDAEPARIFQYYSKTGFLDFRQSHNFIPDKGEVTYHMHMSPVINDCMYRNMYIAKKILVIDLDEYIIPVHNYTLQAMVDTIDAMQTSYHTARSYLFRNAYFFRDFGPDTREPFQLSTLQYTTRIDISELGYAAKSMIDPMACYAMHNHYCWGVNKLYNNGDQMAYVEPNVAIMHHYKKCHLDVFEIKEGQCEKIMRSHHKDETVHRYSKQLRLAVNKHLKKLHLEPIS